MIKITIVALYIASTLAISLWSKKKAKTTRAFEGTNLGLLLCVVAGAGEWLGGTATTGVSEYGFLYGISGAWYTVANGMGVCVLAAFFARLFRRLETPTVSGIIGHYVGEKAKVISSLMLLFIMLALGSVPMVAIGTLGEALFGFRPEISILVLGLGVIGYTVLGGMMAVGYTNILHMIVMYVGALLAVLLCGSDVNGFSGLKATLPESYFSLISIGPSKVSSWIIASVLGACTAQAGLQPILSAKDERTAVKSSFCIAVLVAPFGILMAILGMIARVKFPELENAKMALPTLLLSLPDVWGGFVIASIVAALLSTASPIFLACGTLFTRDIFPATKFYHQNISDQTLLRISKTTTLLAGIICTLCAMLWWASSTILDLTYFAYSLRAALFVILLLGIFWRKTSQRGVILAMLTTVIVGVFWIWHKSVYNVYPIHSMLSETYISIIVALVITVIGSLILRKEEQ